MYNEVNKTFVITCDVVFVETSNIVENDECKFKQLDTITIFSPWIENSCEIPHIESISPSDLIHVAPSINDQEGTHHDELELSEPLTTNTTSSNEMVTSLCNQSLLISGQNKSNKH